jgi:heptosyltransferase-2
VSHEIILTVDILVVRFSAIGDILLTTPLLRALRARHPGARISVLTKRQYIPLLADNPHVDEVFGISRSTPLPALAGQIRGIRYTHLLDLHGSLRTRALRILAPGPWSGYSKRRLAREVLIRGKRNIYPDDVPVPERYFEAAAELDVRPDGGPPEFFLSPAAEERAATWLAQAGIGQQRPLIAIAPGAAHATKRWPVPQWVTLARKVIGTGADLVILGGVDDSALAGELVARLGAHAASAAGALALQETGAVIKRAAALISGDTGVMHMATGVGTPVVALFGPTVRQFGFFPYQAHATVLERDLPCRPCSAQGGPVCPYEHHLCMRQITPENVFTALCRTLA